jgi:hypothetical protein
MNDANEKVTKNKRKEKCLVRRERNSQEKEEKGKGER